MSTGIQFIMYYLIIYSSLITSYTSQVVSSIGSYVPPLPRYSMSTSSGGTVGYRIIPLISVLLLCYLDIVLLYTNS